MRSEARYSTGVLGKADPNAGREKGRASLVYYYSTGEGVPPGIYTCTFCGGNLPFLADCVLPLCPRCDSAEFTRVDQEGNA